MLYILALFIYLVLVFGEFVFWMCDSYFCVVQRHCNYDVRHVRFQARAYEFLYSAA